ncbi:transporter substrate-binding domain-containing protein [Verrucomicrobium sp. GAS474]|uniref:transporter substrate-binding domain-containing protein n=1 Tax=Verrucomicrobium sp. GAS474 TaxID=1882831 RepID=UPI000ABD2447|nr:transporter substrate-binding domain-containing protein [Verrucomicrobium sp. GAS474]
MELGYPPFEMTDAGGKPSGVSVDLARALGEALHRPVRIENIGFDGLIPALQTGKIDLIISSMTATPERARAIAFSDPYLHTGLALLAGRNGPLAGPGDLAKPGLRIAVKNGTTGQLYARDHLPGVRVLVFDSEDAAVLEVTQGKADAFIYDQMSILAHALRHPETTRPFLQPLREEAWAIGLRRGDDALREEVNGFLRDFRVGGGFDALGERYLAAQKAAFARLGVPFVF